MSEYLSDEQIALYAPWLSERDGGNLRSGSRAPDQGDAGAPPGSRSESHDTPMSAFFQRALEATEDANEELLRLLDLLTEVEVERTR